MDSDDSTTNAKLKGAEQSGVQIFAWPDGWSTENALFEALDKELISKLLAFLIDEEIVPRERINNDFARNELGLFDPSSPEKLWKDQAEEDVRRILAASSSRRTGNRKGWFKNIPASIALGEWLMSSALESERFVQSTLYKTYFELLNTFPAEK